MQLVVMYHNNFLQELKNKIAYKDLSQLARYINKNEKLETKTIFVLANLMYCKKALANTAVSTAKINKAGNTILGICRTIGYWACLIMCIVDIIKALMQGDTKSIAKIMMKYALAFAALYFFPWILDLIKEIFA